MQDVRCSIEQAQLQRSFKGETPKEVLTVFFSWEETPTVHAMSTIKSREIKQDMKQYLENCCTSNQYSQNTRLIPRSTYRKAMGEGVRTITHGAHTSTLRDTMPSPFRYLSITVVLLTHGEELSPHKDIQNHRLRPNATISRGEWKGGVLQLEDDKWINCDSKDKWVFLNARETFHRVTEVTGYRLSIIHHTSQHLYRLSSEDWDTLRDAGFPVDLVLVVPEAHNAVARIN